MAEPPVLATSPGPSIRVLAFNRPAKKNALSQALINVFLAQLWAACQDSDVRVIIITGSRELFSAGADINEISALDVGGARRTRYLADLCYGMKAVRKPMIAAVEGMACDIILASQSSRFGLPEVTIGLIPGAGGTQRLTVAVGKFRIGKELSKSLQAMKIILSGKLVSAADACLMGLVSETFDPGTVLANAVNLAKTIANNSSMAVVSAKQAVLRADDLGMDQEFERSLYYDTFGSKDKAEGVDAFLEKRQAQWV
ncbi:hypothetical protein MKZ38_003798 [Zalerion maritima]|uniref:Enoyl-CoA hydratase n=1 Tax=Zalerion maritima TaxID=339359 RepID=A0AAD5RMF9_9PEZI|nr:hypothetical protein MKZ38_003798 [Zalerion maritima]